MKAVEIHGYRRVHIISQWMSETSAPSILETGNMAGYTSVLYLKMLKTQEINCNI